jgi:hypothetical protein
VHKSKGPIILSNLDRMQSVSERLQSGVAGEHLVCYDLIMKGYVAFLAAQGLPYDVIVHTKTGIKTIQVKSTSKKGNYGKSIEIYRFILHRGKKQTAITPETFDFVAFVALDTKKVAYFTSAELMGKNSKIKRTIEFRDRDTEYKGRLFSNGTYRSAYGKFIDDYGQLERENSVIVRENKTCCRCKVEKPMSEFYASASARDKKSSACKTCMLKSIHASRDARKKKIVIAPLA